MNVINVITQYLDDMLFFASIALPIVIVWRLFRWKKRGFQLKETIHELGVLLFVMVLVALFSQTIIPKFGVEQTASASVNLDLFRVVKETYNAIIYLGFWEPFYINFLGNIILFIPIGFLLPLLFRRLVRFPLTILAGLCISIFIEVMQLPQNRSSDVDDLWLNTLGAFIGYLVYLFVLKGFPKFTEAFKKVQERRM